jgi:hypothetical protein
MEDAEGIAKVHGVCFEGEAIDAAEKERHVREGMEIALGDFQRFRAGIDTVERSYSLGDETGPASRSATRIESDCVPWKTIPREQAEVLFENSCELLFVHVRLVEPRPFLSK